MGAILLKRISALVLALLLLCGLGACSNAGKDVRLAAAVQTSSNGEAKRTSVLPREEQVRVSRSDMTVLYFDEISASVCVYDAGAKQLWRALPETEGGANCAMLRVRVLVKDAVYLLSSQSDATVASDVSDGALHLTYDFQKTIGKTNVHLSVPMTFTAEDGTMRVEVDCASLKAPDCGRGVAVLSLEVLPSFGAAKGAAGDTVFVPDGCGALLDADGTTPLSVALPVYGDPRNPKGAAACVAAFGMKRGEGAFIALAQEGDALATIAANRSDNGFCSVGASFAVTAARSDGETLHISGEPYAGKISLSYRFLSGESADTAGMAAAVRELLVRDGTLDASPKRRQSAALPLHVTLVGTAAFAVPGQGSYVSRHTVTTLSQAQDILSLLRSKGVSDLHVTLQSFLRGDGKNGNLRLLSSLSNGVSAKEFLSFAQSQNALVAPSVSAITATSAGRGAKGSDVTSVQSFNGSRITAEASFRLRTSLAKPERLLRSARAFPCDALALTDVGALLAFDGVNESRQTLKNQVQQQLSMLYAAKELTVSGGNLYALKYASFVTELPNTTSVSGSGYRAVPFLQMLLHGYCDYAGAPLNLAEDAETALLKAAEYGEAPAILCYYNDYGNAETGDNCNYLSAASRAQQSYERLNAALSGLGDKRITAHEEVKAGVFATTFGNTATVYVNYNDSDVTVHGVTVEGRSILRIK